MIKKLSFPQKLTKTFRNVLAFQTKSSGIGKSQHSAKLRFYTENETLPQQQFKASAPPATTTTSASFLKSSSSSSRRKSYPAAPAPEQDDRNDPPAPVKEISGSGHKKRKIISETMQRMSTLSEKAETTTTTTTETEKKKKKDKEKERTDRQQFDLDMDEMFKDQAALCEQQFDEVLNPTVSITPPPHDPIDFDKLDQFWGNGGGYSLETRWKEEEEKEEEFKFRINRQTSKWIIINIWYIIRTSRQIIIAFTPLSKI